MLSVLQRVSKASVAINGTVTASIGKGLLVLVCAVKEDAPADVDHTVKKIAQLRIFEDEAGRMNRSVTETGGEVLVVSQFTLAASTKKGNRPSFDAAEAPQRAKELCDAVAAGLAAAGLTVRTGVFGAMMEVSLVNDGPVTVLVDSRE